MAHVRGLGGRRTCISGWWLVIAVSVGARRYVSANPFLLPFAHPTLSPKRIVGTVFTVTGDA